MEVFNCVISLPLGIIALIFVFAGGRRGVRFRTHDYQEDKKERLRDNFFSSFTMMTGICCIFPIISPVNLWGFSIPLSLLFVLVLTPLSMLGASFNSFLFRFPKTLTINVGMWGANNPDGSSLRWFEYTPFAVVVGWMVYYLVYVLSLLISGIKIMSDTAPLRTILVALIFGVVAAVFITIGIHQKFE
jgi:hypothetical protein